VIPVSNTGRRLKLITTGGTIATVKDPVSGQTRPARSGNELLASITADWTDRKPAIEVDVDNLALVASWALTPRDMQRIALHARDVARSGRYTGIVVTHGTQALECTAFLTDLFLDGDVPVVFTGAMLQADSTNSDGPGNLRHALEVAASPKSRNRGALVCFAGRVMPARAAWKWSRSAPDAFRATIEGDALPRRRTFSGELDDRVAIVKAYPGGDGEALLAHAGSGMHGMVIEGLPGQAGLPPSMHESVKETLKQMPVVLSSRAPAGVLGVDPTGGTGEPLMGLGLMSAGELTTEKAWLLLMVALAETKNRQDLAAVFEDVASAREER
jgi:L-asparaginase